MKLQRTIDRRLVWQLVMLSLLTVLPVIMITVNGGRAVRAVLTPSTDPNGSPVGVSEPAAARLEQRATTAPLRFGVYDPAGVFAADKSLKLRHIYISWAAFDHTRLAEELGSLEEQGFEALLTIEPWPIAGSEQPLLKGIVNGQYDRIIDELAEVVRQLKGPVYIAWGHEMDQDLTERYPWSNADPAQYVAAYRYVVDRIRGQVDTPLHWIWAGVLKEGSLRYWPGKDYADFVGMPIYSFPAWDQQTYGFIRDFRTTFEEKRKIVEKLNKPLMITELGVSGSPDFESFWLHQAFMALADYPDLVGVIFFPSPDTEGAWGEDFETPDWRVHPDAIRGLVDWKLR